MATRSYNGQEYQSSTCEVRWTTPEGFEFKWDTWQDVKCKIGRKKKVTNAADGTIDGYTSEMVTSEASLKARKSEWDSFLLAFSAFYPGAEIDSVVFTETIVYGNTYQTLKKDRAQVVMQEVNRDLPRSQDPLMVDMPLAMLSFVENGVPRFQSGE